MFNKYHACFPYLVSPVVPVFVLSAEDSVASSEYLPEVDGLHLGRNCVFSVHLTNSDVLQHLPKKLTGLPMSFQADIKSVITRFPGNFAGVPSHTTLIEHDIDTCDQTPIRQHPYRAMRAK